MFVLCSNVDTVYVCFYLSCLVLPVSIVVVIRYKVIPFAHTRALGVVSTTVL